MKFVFTKLIIFRFFEIRQNIFPRPNALFIAHPECPEEILKYADHVGSTSSLIEFVSQSNKKEFIIGTEPNVIHQMRKKNPEKIFIEVPGAGVFAIVIECVEESLAKIISKSIPVPTIGIGASKHCDGQILVTDDLLGLSNFTPRFIRKYSNIKKIINKSVSRFRCDVINRNFPSRKNIY